MKTRVRPGQELAAARAAGGRISALALGLLAAVGVLLAPTPALAQVPPGTQATPLVGSGIVANCPPPVAGNVAGGTATVGDVTVGFPAGARCAPLAAAADGVYQLAGVTSPTGLRFSSDCANQNGTVVTGGGVDVPPGTIVNGVLFPNGTTVTTQNTPVTFPSPAPGVPGRTAVVNQVISTPNSVTRNAIAFTGGPIVGQVTCGAFAYPLSVDPGSSSGDVPAVATPASSPGNGGTFNNLALLGGGLALVLILAQIAVARRLRSRGDASR